MTVDDGEEKTVSKGENGCTLYLRGPFEGSGGTSFVCLHLPFFSDPQNSRIHNGEPFLILPLAIKVRHH
jgi:hypothetical protein